MEVVQLISSFHSMLGIRALAFQVDGILHVIGITVLFLKISMVLLRIPTAVQPMTD